jgi:hypothetical protein
MDHHRADTAGQQLEPVPTPASTTTAQLAKRFTATHLAEIEIGIGAVNAPTNWERRRGDTNAITRAASLGGCHI